MTPNNRRFSRQAVATLIALLASAPMTLWAAHPLITEDTGTQGAGRWQLEATLDRGRDKSSGALEISDERKLVLSYGAADSLDLIVGVPHIRTRTDDAAAVQGVGDVELAAKWRFYEHQGLSFALRPGVTAPTGDEDRGLGTGRTTSSLFAIMSFETAPWTYHLHIGRTDNRTVTDERRQINHYSVAVARRFSDQLQLVADVSQETNPDKGSNTAIRSAVFGAIYSVSKNFDIDFGYRHGLSDSATDDALLIGLAFRF
jgi:hypothetical protein